jgi:hypothetical protein
MFDFNFLILVKAFESPVSVRRIAGESQPSPEFSEGGQELLVDECYAQPVYGTS